MRVHLVLCLALFSIPATLPADSHAYIMSSGSGSPTVPGAITPFHTATGAFAAPYFVPPGGSRMAVAPNTHQIWQATTAPFCGDCSPFAINVLDPQTGSTLATIPLSNEAAALVFDAAGRYAYVATGDIEYIFLLKIDVATRTIVQTLTTPCGGYLAFSSDTSTLFVSGEVDCNSISAVDPQTMTLTGSITGVNGQMYISGTTLLIINSNELDYFDTATLQQDKTVAVAAGSSLFGVSPDGSKIYIDIPCFLCTPSVIEILDFATGQILASENFSIAMYFPLLSPDGARIAVASSQFLVLDAQTLATIDTVNSLGVPASAVYLDKDTVSMLYSDSGAMMVVDQFSAQVTTTFPLGIFEVAGEAADPVHGRIFTGSDNEYCNEYCPNLNVVGVISNRIIQSFPVEFAPIAFAGGQLYGVSGLDRSPSVYDLSTNVLTNLPVPKLTGYYGAIAYPGTAAPDGKSYWVPYVITRQHSRVDSLVLVYSTATNQVSGNFKTPLPGGGVIVFSPDSSIAYIGESNSVAIYNANTLQQTGKYSFTTTFTSLAISPDGSALYGTDGSAIYVINAATGAQQQTFALPSTVKGAMALSPDGSTLFLADNTNNSVDLVQTATGTVTSVELPYTPAYLVVLPD